MTTTMESYPSEAVIESSTIFSIQGQKDPEDPHNVLYVNNVYDKFLMWFEYTGCPKN